jgi:hypothetical protein
MLCTTAVAGKGLWAVGLWTCVSMTNPACRTFLAHVCCAAWVLVGGGAVLGGGQASFNRAIARVDWMKEPWLLLGAPPQSVSSLDSTHNVMGSVYSVGPNKHGTDDLIEQYAKRCVDAGCCVCA